MKRNWIVLSLCICCTAFAFGCSQKETPETTDTPQVEQEAVSEETTNAPTAKQAVPQVEKLYQDAHAIYEQIMLTGLKCSYDDVIDMNGYTYCRVTDARFPDMPSFQSYLEQYFTKDFIAEDILSENDTRFVEGKGGGLYVLDANRGANIFYAGAVLQEPVVESENAISLTVQGYYTKDTPYDGTIFDTAPEDSSAYEIVDYTFRIVPEGDQWKFDSFALLN